ncbi:MAG: hypothetical protein QHH17_06900 [Candidatus Bathyarchaeota archaeon]|nr:hypothetical protein [Candidatus Bathyarchaeota archaeon]
MTIIEKIYWIRLLLGIVAALASTAYTQARVVPIDVVDYSVFLNGISIAIIVYIISFYIMKFKWATKVEKSQKILTTGVGIYFISWLVFWVLFYTIMAGPPPQP